MNAPFLWKRFNSNSIESHVGGPNELVVDVRPGMESIRISDGVTPGGKLIQSELVSGIKLPSILSPSNGAVDVGTRPVITSNAFIGITPDGNMETHTHTRWQIATDINFSNVAFDSYHDDVNLTSIDLSTTDTFLAPDTTYYARAKYKGSSGLESGWGPAISFTVSQGAPTNEVYKFITYDNSLNAHNGESVATSADGLTVVIGARGWNNARGQVYIYKWNGSSWAETTLQSTQEVSGDRFGTAVSVSGDGDTIVVGSPLDDLGGTQSSEGAIHVFKWNGTSWDATKILAIYTRTNANFGHSVAVNGDGTRIIVGSPVDLGAGISSGAVYMLIWNGSSYVQTKIYPASPSSSVRFGWDVAISEDGYSFAVGTYADNAGSLFIYTWVTNNWNYVKITPTDGVTSDEFGTAVAMSADGLVVVVGTPRQNTNRGAIYIYEWNGSIWGVTKLTQSDFVNNDFFGHDVAISANGNRILVGAYGSGGSARGSAYVYDRDGSSWIETKLLASDGVSGDFYGREVAISGDGNSVLVAGKYTATPESTTVSAMAYLYQ
jgi:hypothetical protein